MEKFEYELIDNFKSYIDTLKNSSFDKEKKEYLCNDESLKIFNFDEIVKKLYPQKQPSSFDAILIDNFNIFCIEFKNSKPSDIKNINIEKKLINSRDVINNICSEYKINKKNYTFIFCVIFKPSLNSSISNRRIKGRIKAEEIKFGLEKYKGEFFDEILTNDTNYFIKNYHLLVTKKELNC